MAKKKAVAAPVLDPSEPVIRGEMTLSGLVRTEKQVKVGTKTITQKGYAVAVVKLSPEGELLAVSIGPSQEYPQFVALEHKRLIAALAAKVQQQ